MNRVQETDVERLIRSRFAAIVAREGGQVAAAAAIGYDQSSLSRYLNGKTALTAALARAMVLRFPEVGREVTAFFWGFEIHETHGLPESDVA